MKILKTVIKFSDGTAAISRDQIEVKSINKYRAELKNQSPDIKSILFEYTNEPINPEP